MSLAQCYTSDMASPIMQTSVRSGGLECYIRFDKPPLVRSLWIVQEIHLANHCATIRCGYDEIFWPRFRRAVICVVEKTELPMQGFSDKAVKLNRLMESFPESNFDLSVYISTLCRSSR
jgi:hypothetical protein